MKLSIIVLSLLSFSFAYADESSLSYMSVSNVFKSYDCKMTGISTSVTEQLFARSALEAVEKADLLSKASKLNAFDVYCVEVEKEK